LISIDVVISFSSLIHLHIITSIMPNIMLSRSNNFIFRIIQKLVPMSQPSNNSGNHEENWEHISWKSHCFVNNSTIKIYIRIKLSLNEVRVTESNSLQFNCNLNKLLLSCNLENLLSNLLHNFSSRIIIFVNSVAKTV